MELNYLFNWKSTPRFYGESPFAKKNSNLLSLKKILSLPTQKREKLYQALREVYSELDQELKELPQPCTGCGECCHFTKAEHRLYGSSLELALLMEKHPNPTVFDEDRCPHQKEASCQVRNERLIGCRTFFRLHSHHESQAAENLYEKYLSRLKNLYQEKDLEWEYRDLMSVYS